MALVEVVKYNGSPDVFAWKYPNQELGTWTQLIVNESQEAVLFKGGQALDVFSAGRHTLGTANIPILNELIKLPFGGRSPFTAEIWYVNKAHTLNVKWGTPTPIQLQDPRYGIFVPVRSHGQFGIKIEDSKKFLVKLVGTLPKMDQSTLVSFFRGLYLNKAKDSISSYLVHKQIGVLDINAYLAELSTYIEERMKPVLDDYGISLNNFYINDINIPDDDSGVKKLKDALAKRAEMNIIGYDYQQERTFNTMEGAVKNPGTSAGLMGAGLGLGMGIPMGHTMGNQFGKMAAYLNTTPSKAMINCPKCKQEVDADKKFCPDCGYAFQNKEEKSVLCDKCGAEMDASKKFCPECGDVYNPCPNCGADQPEGFQTCSECGYANPQPCPNCGANHTESAKFCPECGMSLINKCPACSTEISSDAKFCPECGKKLESGGLYE